MFTEYKGHKKNASCNAYWITKYDSIMSLSTEQQEARKTECTHQFGTEGQLPILFTAKVKVNPGDFLVTTDKGVVHYSHQLFIKHFVL